MQTLLLLVGKTNDSSLVSLMDEYTERIRRFQPFEIQIIPELRNKGKMRSEIQKQKEGESIIQQFEPADFIVLLDEKGKSFDSVQFSEYLNKKRAMAYKRIVFVVGGPFGFSKAVYDKAQEKISLSSMTFSHQMIRIFFLEQLYRANTIIKNFPYHNK
ncbi:MAG: 23S rRNA (pseudouridine(1915)-N(3))-methyltransferase RlmH [Flavobacteriaceae bacterium]|nr:23S rRNA (pseudouridine(1915)-N(3))-methyltransferase RlmH [Flavobacteriaceae bacterium]MDG1968893.1 23S rRNA (pseudouridine(1915)-N(3))-methyltransferase RlmH [Flavobacteriaceae bacterium]